MNVERVPINSLSANPDNPRVIKDDKFHKLVASVKAFPQMLELRPIVVDANRVVLGGNMRLKACKAAGLKEVPVVVADTLTPEQQREFVIKDNVGFGEWDWDVLANAWDAEQLEEWGLDVPNFEKQENGLTDPDDVPEPPVDPITKPGDLILLGRHRLLCGDSTDALAWDTLMQGEQADAVWTDPPYGVSYVGGTKEKLTIENDSLNAEELSDFLRSALSLALVHCRAGGVWYVAAPNTGAAGAAFVRVLHEIGIYRHSLVWLKDAFVLGRSDYHYRHEPIFYGWKDGAAHPWFGGRSQDSVLEVPRPKRNAEHPTMKPVALVTRCLENSTERTAVVVDCFGGSGTTLLAAEAIGRNARLLELSPVYCDVIVARWEAFTGAVAVRPNSEGAVEK